MRRLHLGCFIERGVGLDCIVIGFLLFDVYMTYFTVPLPNFSSSITKLF